MEQEHFQLIGISLGLGLLVGLQREHANSEIAGIRTFPLVTLLGTLLGLLAKSLGVWIVANGFMGIIALIVIGNIQRNNSEHKNSGQTTEAAILLMYSVGAYLALQDKTLAVAVGGLVAVLLHFKGFLHGLVERIGYKDIRVVMQFVFLSLVVLPVLPNQTYGPYNVLNPHDIWLMVVLIVGIGIIGYFSYKFFGKGAGVLLGGILGGLVSSTATTVSYARKTRETPDASLLAAFVILTASTVAFIRILVEIAVVAPQHISQLGLPLGAVLLLMLLTVGALYIWSRKKGEKTEMPEQGNPAELKSAFIFAALYGLIILATAAAKDHFGNQGLFIVSFFSGLTDVDAITLSTAKMVQAKSLADHTGWQLILVAALANLVFKAGMVAVLGDRKLLYKVALLFSITLTGGLLVLWLWPQGSIINQ